MCRLDSRRTCRPWNFAQLTILAQSRRHCHLWFEEEAAISVVARATASLGDLLSQRRRDRSVGGGLPVDLLEYRALGVLPLWHGLGLSLQGLRRRGLREVGDSFVDERRVGDGIEGRQVGRGELVAISSALSTTSGRGPSQFGIDWITVPPASQEAGRSGETALEQ